MIVYLPDTITLSHFMRRHPLVQGRFTAAQQAQIPLILSSAVEYEARRGLLRKRVARLDRLFDNLIVDLECRVPTRATWHRAAQLWAFSRDQGFPLPDGDLLIAAHALDLEAVLVTSNTRHFLPFAEFGLQLEDWTQP